MNWSLTRYSKRRKIKMNKIKKRKRRRKKIKTRIRARARTKIKIRKRRKIKKIKRRTRKENVGRVVMKKPRTRTMKVARKKSVNLMILNGTRTNSQKKKFSCLLSILNG